MQVFYPEYPSIVQSEMIVQWKKDRKVYNFEKLPDTAIICVEYSILKHLNTFGTQKIKGIKGRHFIKNKLLLCSEFDNGAPGIVNLLEELRALNIERFIFLGSAGVLSNDIKESNVYSVAKAISGSGITSFYSNQKFHSPKNQGFYTFLQKNLGIRECVCYSTDAPFRETKPLLDELCKQGVQLIDMECAAVYAFAEFHNLTACCFLVAADNLCETWTAPKDFKKVITAQKAFISNLLKLIG